MLLDLVKKTVSKKLLNSRHYVKIEMKIVEKHMLLCCNGTERKSFLFSSFVCSVIYLPKKVVIKISGGYIAK